jgi:hypothetical protein
MVICSCCGRPALKLESLKILEAERLEFPKSENDDDNDTPHNNNTHRPHERNDKDDE